MSKAYKFWTGALSLLPFMIMIVYMVTVVSFMLNMMRYESQGMTEPPVSAIIWMISVGILMGVTALAALIFFLVHIVNNKIIDSNERLMWTLVIIFASIIAFPIYWYMKIYKQQNNLPPGHDLSSQTIAR